ncbi:MAG: AMP-binding protein, partial [Solirubrobacteraceae bacterium]
MGSAASPPGGSSAASPRAAAGSRAVGAATIAEAFRITAEDHPDRVAVRTKDDELSLTWSELRDRVDALARGLHELGVRRGDTVALMLANRPEFHIADLAVMTLGATPFSIYATSSPEQIAYVVGDAQAKVAIVEELFAGQFLAARGQLPELATVVVLEGVGGDGAAGTIAWADVEATESGFDVEAAWRAVEPEDVITLIYTSGTTGPPKGVQLVHRNLMAATRGVEELIRFPDGSKVISWLPSAHIAERMAHHYLPIVYAMTITCCPNPREVVAYLPAVKPTWFFAVPRIWEKLKAGMEGFLATGEGAEQKRAWLD